jgi:hypothetical protein
MNIEPEIVSAIVRVAIAGGIGGLLGGLFASSRSSLFGSALMGIIGGIALATILRIVSVDPLVDAGQGFSYVYGAVGGLVLGLVVSASNR